MKPEIVDIRPAWEPRHGALYVRAGVATPESVRNGELAWCVEFRGVPQDILKQAQYGKCAAGIICFYGVDELGALSAALAWLEGGMRFST